MALALAGSGLGIILIVRGAGLFGWVVFVIFDTLAIVSFLAILPNSSYLMLTPKGFTYRDVLRVHNFKWGDVEEFKVLETAHHEKVGFDYSNRSITFPDNYGLGPDELAHLMNLWKSKWEEEV